MSDRKIDDTTGVETTGHSWDGIEELNNPLPVSYTHLTLPTNREV